MTSGIRPPRFIVCVPVLLILAAIGGCIHGTAVLTPDSTADSDYAVPYDHLACHDTWPQIEVSANQIVAARSPRIWRVSYPANQMLMDTVDRAAVRLRCRDADQSDIHLVVSPADLYVSSLGGGLGREIPAVKFDLSVRVEDAEGAVLTVWYIMPWTRIAQMPVRTGLVSLSKVLDLLEPEITTLTYQAMDLAMEMALECFREMQKLPMLRPNIFADSGYQCLPPGPERRRQTLGQRINEQVRQQQ